MSVKWEGTTKDWLKKVEKVAGQALGQAAETLVQEIQDGMPGAGASGFSNMETRRLSYKSSTPGAPPGVRTNRLKSSITSQKDGKLKRVVGTNVEYARMMEFGGTINHPGGTAYKVVGAGKAVFVGNDKATAGLKRTKAHTITIPARPFMKPGLKKAKKKMLKRFIAQMKKGLA